MTMRIPFTRRALAGLVIAVAVTVLVPWILWQRKKVDRPRREALNTLARLDDALRSTAGDGLLPVVVVPPSLSQKTQPEQVEFLMKALRDEISPEGIRVLKENGQFGPLKEIFPAEAERWAAQAGVSAESCIAFQASGNGIIAEAVLYTNAGSCRVVRINNVRQLALPPD